MSKLTRNNLHLFCRICLSALRPTQETVYNIQLVPNLAKLLMICTSLDFSGSNDDLPKRLCQLCFDKLQDIQLFRNMAQHSAELLSIIIKGDKNDESEKCLANEEKTYDSERKSSENYHHYGYDERADDDQLLLPELSSPSFCEKSIKAEPIDSEYRGMHINQISGQLNSEDKCDSEEVKIKYEIDSDFDETSNLYEKYELNNSNYSTEEDYSDDNDNEDESTNTASFGLYSQKKRSMISLLHNTASRCGTMQRKRGRNKKSLKCPLCDKQVYKQVYLDAHIRGIHEGHEKPFLCVKCHKEFTRYNQLHVHIQSSHVKKEKFECEINGCNAVFKLMTTLETHRKVVHTCEPTLPFSLNLQRVVELHQSQLAQETEIEHICQQCFKKYSSKRALTEHLKRHANIKEHICQVCGVAKVTRTELQTHMRTHEPNAEKFKCTICPQEFNHKNAIQRHIRVVHEGLRPFSCSYCPKRFGTRNSKMCHERLHTGERPFCCEICNKSFAQSEGLKSHMKNHDKSLRTHVCRFCSQRFITRKNLIDHEERHRGDKPHICDICSRGFYKYADLLTHRQIHEDSFEINKGTNKSGCSSNETNADNSKHQEGNHFNKLSPEFNKTKRINCKIQKLHENKSYENNMEKDMSKYISRCSSREVNKLPIKTINIPSNNALHKETHKNSQENSYESFIEENENVGTNYIAGCGREYKEVNDVQNLTSQNCN